MQCRRRSTRANRNSRRVGGKVVVVLPRRGVPSAGPGRRCPSPRSENRPAGPGRPSASAGQNTHTRRPGGPGDRYGSSSAGLRATSVRGRSARCALSAAPRPALVRCMHRAGHTDLAETRTVAILRHRSVIGIGVCFVIEPNGRIPYLTACPSSHVPVDARFDEPPRQTAVAGVLKQRRSGFFGALPVSKAGGTEEAQPSLPAVADGSPLPFRKPRQSPRRRAVHPSGTEIAGRAPAGNSAVSTARPRGRPPAGQRLEKTGNTGPWPPSAS